VPELLAGRPGRAKAPSCGVLGHGRYPWLVPYEQLASSYNVHWTTIGKLPSWPAWSLEAVMREGSRYVAGGSDAEDPSMSAARPLHP